jgi:hypothetical protein
VKTKMISHSFRQKYKPKTILAQFLRLCQYVGHNNMISQVEKNKKNKHLQRKKCVTLLSR